MEDKPLVAVQPDIVHTAAEAVEQTLFTIDDRRAQVAAGTALANVWGIPDIDHYINPYWKGQTIYIVAMMSNGKSYIARMHAINVIQSLMAANENRAIVWITTEEPVEKVTAHFLSTLNQADISSTDIMSGRISDVQMHYLYSYVAEVTTWPLFIIGNSLSRRNDSGRQERGLFLTRNAIEEGIDFIMNDLGIDIAFMILDYMQQVAIDDNDYTLMTPHMNKTVNWNRNMAMWTGAPFEICAQSPRRVAEKALALPGMTDIEWTNKAGQDADLIMTSLFPKTTNGIGARLEGLKLNNGEITELTVTERHMLVKVAKNREGPAGAIWLLEGYPELMKWDLVVPHKYNLNAPLIDKDGDYIEPDITPEPEQVELNF